MTKDEIFTTLIKAAASETVKKIVHTTIEKIKIEKIIPKKAELDKVIDKFPFKYETHFNEILKWSSAIPFIGLATPKNTKASTIKLIISSDIYKSSVDSKSKIPEEEILISIDNILLVKFLLI